MTVPTDSKLIFRWISDFYTSVDFATGKMLIVGAGAASTITFDAVSMAAPDTNHKALTLVNGPGKVTFTGGSWAVNPGVDGFVKLTTASSVLSIDKYSSTNNP